MLPLAHVSHMTGGRLRLRIPPMRRNRPFFEKLSQSLRLCEGVRSVDVNPLTASVLISHATTSDAILQFGMMEALFTLRKDSPRRTTLHRTVTGSFGALDSLIKRYTGDAVDAGGLAFLSLVAVGIYQISRGNFTAPAWYTLFWYGMNVFLKSDAGSGEDNG